MQDTWESCNMLVLKMQEGATNQGMQVASGSWKGKEMDPPGASKKERGPANTVILAHWDLGQTSDLQNCKILNLCC